MKDAKISARYPIAYTTSQTSFAILSRRHAEASGPQDLDTIVEFQQAVWAHANELDHHPLDLLGDDSFRSYLWHCGQHNMLPIYSARIIKGASVVARSYFRLNDVVGAMLDLSRVMIASSAMGVDHYRLIKEWTYYLESPKGYGVFSEYAEFTEMWAPNRVYGSPRGRIFLDVIFSYTRTRLGDPASTH